MNIKASAGGDRTKDVRSYCYSLSLTAQTEEEGRWLAVLHAIVMGRTDGLPCLSGTHKWKDGVLGGPPDAAESQERVRSCEACGWEYQGDEA